MITVFVPFLPFRYVEADAVTGMNDLMLNLTSCHHSSPFNNFLSNTPNIPLSPAPPLPLPQSRPFLIYLLSLSLLAFTPLYIIFTTASFLSYTLCCHSPASPFVPSVFLQSYFPPLSSHPRYISPFKYSLRGYAASYSCTPICSCLLLVPSPQRCDAKVACIASLGTHT